MPGQGELIRTVLAVAGHAADKGDFLKLNNGTIIRLDKAGEDCICQWRAGFFLFGVKF